MLELDPAQEAVRGEAADILLPGDELGDGLLQAGVAPLLDPVLGPHHQRPVQLALGGAGQVGDLLTSCDLLVTYLRVSLCTSLARVAREMAGQASWSNTRSVAASIILIDFLFGLSSYYSSKTPPQLRGRQCSPLLYRNSAR